MGLYGTLSVCLLLLLAHICDSRIYQCSEAGENGMMNFTSHLQGGQRECNVLYANGTIDLIATILQFNGDSVYSSSPSDMYIVVTNSETGQCLQYGGYNAPYSSKCSIAGSWPSSWDSHKSGTYNAVANITSWKYSGAMWSICIGNGYIQEPYPDPDPVYYSGTLNFTSLVTTSLPPSLSPTGIPSAQPSISSTPTLQPVVPTTPAPSVSLVPTAQPSRHPTPVPSVSYSPTAIPFVVTTECIDHTVDPIINISFDASLSGKQKVCAGFSGVGLLRFVNISLFFSGSSTKEYPYDMLLSLAYIGQNISQSTSVQIGGWDVFLPNTNNAGRWPASWKSSADGWYYASVDVARYLVQGSGEYEICMVNAWQHAKEVSYKGFMMLPDLRLPGCTVSPTIAPTVTPTLASTQTPTQSTPPQMTSFPTSSPTARHIEQASSVGQAVKVKFDLNIKPFECVCVLVPGYGLLGNLSTSVSFSSTNSDMLPSDLLVVVSAPDEAACLEVGGRSGDGVNATVCGCGAPLGTYLWSPSMNSDAALHNNTVDVSGAQMEGSSGNWQVISLHSNDFLFDGRCM
jgi:hypothetical protein